MNKDEIVQKLDEMDKIIQNSKKEIPYFNPFNEDPIITNVKQKVIYIRNDEIPFNSPDLLNEILMITKKYYILEDKKLNTTQYLSKDECHRHNIDISNADSIDYIWQRVIYDIFLDKKTKSGVQYQLLQKYDKHGFCSIPKQPSEDFMGKIQDDSFSDIYISNQQDIKELLRQDYEITLYRSPDQYKKDLAHLIIKNKKHYGVANKSDDEIYFNITQPTKIDKNERNYNIGCDEYNKLLNEKDEEKRKVISNIFTKEFGPDWIF